MAHSDGQAIAIENASPYGNAASIYTDSGGTAEWFCARFNAGTPHMSVCLAASLSL